MIELLNLAIAAAILYKTSTANMEGIKEHAHRKRSVRMVDLKLAKRVNRDNAQQDILEGQNLR